MGKLLKLLTEINQLLKLLTLFHHRRPSRAPGFQNSTSIDMLGIWHPAKTTWAKGTQQPEQNISLPLKNCQIGMKGSEEGGGV